MASECGAGKLTALRGEDASAITGRVREFLPMALAAPQATLLARVVPPDNMHGARFLPLDLNDAAACEQLAANLPGITHLVYAALYERPALVAGWREREQIEINDRMFRNVFDPLQRHAKNLRHVTLLQGTKAYGVHVRPLAVPARENRSEMHEQPNFYLLESGKSLARFATGQGLELVDPASRC